MDELTTLATAWKELTPWALGALLASLIVYRVFPYLQERIRKETKQLEIESEQSQAENQQENVWLSIYEKQTQILDRHLKLLDDIEKRTQERHVEGLRIMQGVKEERDQKIDSIQNAIKTVPALVIEAQQPHLSALNTSVQDAMNTLEKNVMARLETVEKNIPDAIKHAVQGDLTAIREQISALSELVNKGCDTHGTEQPSVGNSFAVGCAGDLSAGEPDGVVQPETSSAGGVGVAETSAVDPLMGGSTDRHDPAAAEPGSLAA